VVADRAHALAAAGSLDRRGQSDILVDVHPGLLSREVIAWQAINFPKVGLGNNLLIHHT
jgi:hypothetical protein